MTPPADDNDYDKDDYFSDFSIKMVSDDFWDLMMAKIVLQKLWYLRQRDRLSSVIVVKQPLQWRSRTLSKNDLLCVFP